MIRRRAERFVFRVKKPNKTGREAGTHRPAEPILSWEISYGYTEPFGFIHYA